jgi:hypothetical protein
MRIIAENAYQRLAAAVILQAILDSQSRRDPVARLDAVLWLGSSECGLFTQVLGLEADIFYQVMEGKPKAPNRWRRGVYKTGGKL